MLIEEARSSHIGTCALIIVLGPLSQSVCQYMQGWTQVDSS